MTVSRVLPLVLITVWFSCVTLQADETALNVKEPAKAETLAPRTPERARWAWNQPPIEITATGDLAWRPEPFHFEAGASVRYIDFENGDDNKAGDSQQAAWKHHPWDPNATGTAKACQGVQTYVFKRGVTYRGCCTPSNPARRTTLSASRATPPGAKAKP